MTKGAPRVTRTPASQELGTVVGSYLTGTTRLQGPGQLTLPTGARTLTLWFQSNDVDGCQQWDSAYGQNYAFTIQ